MPAEARKLAIVSITPQGLPHDIMTAPRLMGQDHRRILTVRLQRIDGADVIPVDDLRGPADDIVLIEALDNGDQAVEAFPVDMLFTVPKRFTECLYRFALLLGQGYFAESMGADDIQRIRKLLVLQHLGEKFEFGPPPVAETMELDVAEAALVQRATHVLGEIGVPALFIVAAQGVQFQAVHFAQPPHPGDVVIHHPVCPETAHPGRRTPGRGIQGQFRIAFDGFLQHPPHVSPLEVGVALEMAVGRHAPLRGISITRDFHEDGADRSPEHRLENQVHDLGFLGFGIIFQEDGSGSTSVDGSDSIEALACQGIADTDFLRLPGVPGSGGNA